MAAALPEKSYTNPFVQNLGSIYDGLMVQLNDHVNDADDVVPEFSEEIKPMMEHVRAEEKHFDFQGKEFKEIYDEWRGPWVTAWPWHDLKYDI